MARTVILVEDTFTSSFDGQVLEAATKLLLGLGYQVLRLLPRANGKALHVLGFRQAFASIAKNQMGTLAQYDALGATLVGLDAATSLMYEHEYREFTETKVQVLGLETLLHRDFEAGWWLPQDRLESRHTYRLFSHCTEQSLRPQTSDAWLAVFRHFGLAIEPVRSGCCGMAGMFGHEFENQAISQRLFELSWRDALGKHPSAVLATGFSCRCQVERLAGFRPQHPIEVLNQSVIGCKATTRLAQ